MILKPTIDRRTFFGATTKVIGGASLALSGIETLVPQQSGLIQRLLRLAHLPSGLAMAQALQSATTPVIQICCIDKMSIPLVFPARGTVNPGDLTGLDGTENYAGQPVGAATGAGSSWRGLDVTSLWSKAIAGMRDGHNLAFFPQFTSNSGGHSLQNTDVSMELGGLNYMIENGAATKGLLGPVGFAIRADANNSQCEVISPCW